MAPSQKIFLPYFLLGVVALMGFLMLFYNGFPIGDDYKNQIIGFDAFLSHVKAGDPYPRWFSGVNQGFGGAHLFFYPPFIFYIGLLVDFVTFGALSTLQVISGTYFLLLFASGLSCYAFLSSICERKAAWLGAALYMLLPYHLWIDVYERNATAEFSAYIWVPLLFLFIGKDLSRPRFFAGVAICYFLLIVSHLPSAVFVSPFLGAYALFKAWEIGNRSRALAFLLWFGGAIVTGMLLSGLYLFPAMTLQEHTRAAYALWEETSFKNYALWFLWPKNSCPGYGTFCTLLFFTGLVQLLLPVFIFLFSLGALSKSKKYFKLSMFLMLLIVSSLFMMTPASSFLWEISPPLQKIQFPYRILLVQDFLFVSLFSLCLTAVVKNKGLRAFPWFGVALLPLILLTAYTAIFVQRSWHPDQAFFDQYFKSRILPGEFIPKNEEMTIDIKDFIAMEQMPSTWWSDEEGAALNLVSQGPREMLFDVTMPQDGEVSIRQFYFPGWDAYVITEDGTTSLPVHAAEPYGQISLKLPEGEYQLVIRLPMLRAEKIGVGLSLLGIMVLIGLALWPRKRAHS